MVNMFVVYEGALRCALEHGPSKYRIETDAPADNHGKAQRFSPTDLVGAALGSCIATTLGIAGLTKGWDLTGMRIAVGKTMSADPPRRIARLDVEMWMPTGVLAEHRTQIEHIARTCPVHKSIHPDLAAPVTIHWPD
jgi:putative redox protein